MKAGQPEFLEPAIPEPAIPEPVRSAVSSSLARAALRDLGRSARAAAAADRLRAQEAEGRRLGRVVEWAGDRRTFRGALRRAGIPVPVEAWALSAGANSKLLARVNGHWLQLRGDTLARLDGQPLAGAADLLGPPGADVAFTPVSDRLLKLMDRADVRLRVVRLLGAGAVGLSLLPAISQQGVEGMNTETGMLMWGFISVMVWVSSVFFEFREERFPQSTFPSWPGLLAWGLLDLGLIMAPWLLLGAGILADQTLLLTLIVPLVSLQVLATRLLLPGHTEALVTALWRRSELELPELEGPTPASGGEA